MLSIVIITKNEEKYLPVILNSFRKQSFHDYEIIISDNHSSDATLEIAKQSNCIITSGTNPSNCRNNGAGKAKGEIILFIDADMRIDDPNFLEIVNEKLRDNAVGAVCNVKIHPSEENVIDILLHFFLNTFIKFLLFIGVGTGRGGCQIVKQRYFDNYDENITVGEDVDLFKRLRKKGKILFLNLIIYESKRRYNKLGYLKIIFEWIKSGIFNFILGNKYNKKRVEVR